ncbi:hypothetical protein DdX_13203 [Ditylenchus destructor]|uniref:Uncharacterized protein n=1 Tax=Ditylenchus destructor TaxID=166010 RepID=A0AAD4QWR2_9BILA|nr:hypothetical protein DdX_13203 [Ditylenchus destructor]
MMSDRKHRINQSPTLETIHFPHFQLSLPLPFPAPLACHHRRHDRNIATQVSTNLKSSSARHRPTDCSMAGEGGAKVTLLPLTMPSEQLSLLHFLISQINGDLVG